VNNLVIGNPGGIGFDCNPSSGSLPPVIQFTDAWASGGIGFDGSCASEANTDGNISADPMFGFGGIPHTSLPELDLADGSPAINTGTNSVPDLPAKDLAGRPRIVDGNGTGAIVDLGAYEFVPLLPFPSSLAFGVQPVGSSSTKLVKLVNNLDTNLVISFLVPKGFSISGCDNGVQAHFVCGISVTFHPETSGNFNGTISLIDGASNSPQTIALSGKAR